MSIKMPMGRVMADSRKEPTVKARFSISSWSLQMGQPFISRYSSESEMFEWLRLEVLAGGQGQMMKKKQMKTDLSQMAVSHE